MESCPQFSIIIPFFRGGRGHDILFRTIDSCLAQIGAAFEIRLVTNLPDPQVERVLLSRADPRIFLECTGRRGVNAARNLGASTARGELLLFLDDDCTLARNDFLLGLAELFSRHTDYSVLGGPYRSKTQAPWRVRGYNAMASAWISVGVDLTKSVSPAINLLGGNLCVRREVFEKFSFDEKIVSGGDETEFLRRLSAAGELLGYAPSLAVTHSADGSWGGVLGRAWRQGRARDKNNISTPSRSTRAFLRALKQEPSLLPFSLVHFPALYLAQKTPKFSRAIKRMRNYEQKENLST